MEHNAAVQAAFEAAMKAVLAYAEAISEHRADKPPLFFVAQHPHIADHLHLTVLGRDAALLDILGGAAQQFPDLTRIYLKASLKSPDGPSLN